MTSVVGQFGFICFARRTLGLSVSNLMFGRRSTFNLTGGKLPPATPSRMAPPEAVALLAVVAGGVRAAGATHDTVFGVRLLSRRLAHIERLDDGRACNRLTEEPGRKRSC
jgi:hypothetical protein